jgi:hypothetical protein
MQYSHPDAELVRQPIGYWSWAAYSSVVGHIRKALATVGLTQPQWWVLNQLGDPAGVHGREGSRNCFVATWTSVTNCRSTSTT